MKSEDRCRETFQGDRCVKPKWHGSPVVENPDEEHEGKFTRWTGADKKVVAKAKGAVPCMTRATRRKVDQLVAFAERAGQSRDYRRGIGVLDFVIRGLTRGK